MPGHAREGGKTRAHSSITAILTENGGSNERRNESGNKDSKLRLACSRSRSRSRSLAPSFGERISGFSITVGRGHKSRDNYLGRNDRTAARARSSQHRRPPRRLIRPPPRRKEQKTTNARGPATSFSHLNWRWVDPPKKVGFGIA